MKKVIGGFAALAFLFVVASCGGVSEDALVGKWSVDPSSINLELGDGVPADMKKMVEGQKKEMMSEGSEEMDKVTIEFKEGGKLLVSAEGNTEEGTWSLDGDNLTVGMEGTEITLQVEMDGDSMTATLTAEEIMNQIKKQGMEEQVKAMAGTELDKMIDGTSISVTFNKK